MSLCPQWYPGEVTDAVGDGGEGWGVRGRSAPEVFSVLKDALACSSRPSY